MSTFSGLTRRRSSWPSTSIAFGNYGRQDLESSALPPRLMPSRTRQKVRWGILTLMSDLLDLRTEVVAAALVEDVGLLEHDRSSAGYYGATCSASSGDAGDFTSHAD